MANFEDGAWYTGTVSSVEYVKSEKKGTPGLQVTVDVSDRGAVTGVWWLTGSLVNHPEDKQRKVPQWEAAQIRCKQFGCTEEGLKHPGTWLKHIQEVLGKQQMSVLVEVNHYGDVSAATMCKPKAGGGGGFKAAPAAASPFAAPVGGGDPFAVTDDDVPF